MRSAFFGPILKIFVWLAVLLMLIGGAARLPAAAAQRQMPTASPQGQPPPAKLLAWDGRPASPDRDVKSVKHRDFSIRV